MRPIPARWTGPGARTRELFPEPTGEHIAAAFESFRPFSRIPQGNVGDMEQAAFLLDRPAVAQDAAGVLFKPDKIKEPERLIKMDNLRIGRYIELPDLIARSGMETADDRHAVLPAKCSEGCKVTPEPVGQIDILRAVESHQEKRFFSISRRPSISERLIGLE